MKFVAVAVAILCSTACHSPSSRSSGSAAADYAKSQCALLGHAVGSIGYLKCFGDNYPATPQGTVARNGAEADNPLWGQLINSGAQLMQGPPRPQVTTTNCIAYGNNANCTSTTQ